MLNKHEFIDRCHTLQVLIEELLEGHQYLEDRPDLQSEVDKIQKVSNED